MKTNLLERLTLYRYRYAIGYGLVGLVLIALVVVKFWNLPDGLSSGEIASAAAAGNLNFLSLNPSDLINLPYRILQKICLHFGGLSAAMIRLPGVILALGGGGAATILLLRRFSRPGVAVIAGFLTFTSSLWLGLGRSGDGLIAPVILTLVILWAAINVLRRTGHTKTLIWKILIGICAALLLYSPLGIWTLLILAAAGLAHPAIRLIFVKMKPWKMIVGILCGLILLTPLGWAILRAPSVGLSLLGWDGGFSLANFGLVGQLFLGFKAGFAAGYFTPAISLVGLAIVVLGLIQILKSRSSARSILLIPWTAVGLILTIYRPANLSFLLVPMILLTAVGLSWLIQSWYKLFPRNPYARVAALIPLAILVIGLGYTDFDRYVLTAHYSAAATRNFDPTLPAVRTALAKYSKSDKVLLVPADQANFYNLLTRDFSNLKINQPIKKGDAVIATGGQTLKNQTPRFVVAGWRQSDAPLVKVYQK
ncbi:MAG: hypothetical protein LBM73_01030 [Candidatus Nomurabacteria bacterium]|nr:hypothetical protein [Candidatus Nomurabacteria bacterium]